MKKLFVQMLLLGLLTPLRTYAQAGGNLTGVLSRQGLAGAKLERRYGNHLFVSVSINNRHGALLIDKGSPNTLIDRNSVNTFGLAMEKTDSSVGGLFGQSWERLRHEQSEKHCHGELHADERACGNRGLVRSGPQAQLCRNRCAHLRFQGSDHASPAACLMAQEMGKLGSLVDCTRQTLYINPNGASPADHSGESGAFPDHSQLYWNLPMRLAANDHFDVEGALNSHATKFIVDTGSANTLIDTQVAVKSGTGVTAPAGYGAGGASEGVEGMNRTGAGRNWPSAISNSQTPR